LYHQFECLETGVAYELYWAEFNHNDIKRDTVGYKDDGTVNVSVEDADVESMTLTLHDADSSYITMADSDTTSVTFEPDIITIDDD